MFYSLKKEMESQINNLSIIDFLRLLDNLQVAE